MLEFCRRKSRNTTNSHQINSTARVVQIVQRSINNVVLKLQFRHLSFVRLKCDSHRIGRLTMLMIGLTIFIQSCIFPLKHSGIFDNENLRNFGIRGSLLKGNLYINRSSLESSIGIAVLNLKANCIIREVNHYGFGNRAYIGELRNYLPLSILIAYLGINLSGNKFRFVCVIRSADLNVIHYIIIGRRICNSCEFLLGIIFRIIRTHFQIVACQAQELHRFIGNNKLRQGKFILKYRTCQIGNSKLCCYIRQH